MRRWRSSGSPRRSAAVPRGFRPRSTSIASGPHWTSPRDDHHALTKRDRMDGVFPFREPSVRSPTVPGPGEPSSRSSDAEGILTMTRFSCYHFTDEAGSLVTCSSLESVRRFLRNQESWAPGSYEVLVTPAFLPTPAVPGVRWGVAIKHPDGS